MKIAPKNKILAICNLHADICLTYSKDIEYIPHLSNASQSEWENIIQSTKPRTIIFGTDYFTREMMMIWRKYLPNELLHIVRKGVCLTRCDLAAAKYFSIDVSNTPGINAQYVADFINNHLFQNNHSDDHIAVIGVGKIGKKIAMEAIKRKLKTTLYSRSLSHGDNINQKLKSAGLESHFIQVAKTLEQTMMHANKIAISLPLSTDTQGIISSERITLIPRKSMLVSVSSPHIFTNQALRNLYDRNDLSVVIDHLKSDFSAIYPILGIEESLRPNFVMDEKAAAGSECQKAMSLAAIEKCLHLQSTDSSTRP